MRWQHMPCYKNSVTWGLQQGEQGTRGLREGHGIQREEPWETREAARARPAASPRSPLILQLTRVMTRR